MKQPKEIARKSDKPKRGREFVIIETGQTVYLDRVKSATLYFVCDVPPPDNSLEGNYFDISVDKLSEPGKKYSSISSTPKQLTSEQRENKGDLNLFFKEMAEVMPVNCQECGKPLLAATLWAKRCCTAHIFPKEHFPSIETNSDNIFFLGPALLCRCNCHDGWDRTDAEHRKTMKIYPKAVIQFETKLKHLMPRDELKRAYKYLGILWD